GRGEQSANNHQAAQTRHSIFSVRQSTQKRHFLFHCNAYIHIYINCKFSAINSSYIWSIRARIDRRNLSNQPEDSTRDTTTYRCWQRCFPIPFHWPWQICAYDGTS
ncbi:unnamed protein product, partial [Callosobruchus maculatus]